MIRSPQSEVLEGSLHVAGKIEEYIFDSGLGRVSAPTDVERFVREKAYRLPAALVFQ
jgi:malate dehydrogenase (oxaloacetate-decarboxylating)(NADP+)